MTEVTIKPNPTGHFKFVAELVNPDGEDAAFYGHTEADALNSMIGFTDERIYTANRTLERTQRDLVFLRAMKAAAQRYALLGPQQSKEETP